MTIKCLWCGKDFEWDPSMYQFCDSCIWKIEEAEEIVWKLTGATVNLLKELERRISQLEQKGKKGGELWTQKKYLKD